MPHLPYRNSATTTFSHTTPLNVPYTLATSAPTWFDHCFSQVEDLPDPPAEAGCNSPPPPEADPPAPASPVYANGVQPFDMFAQQGGEEEAEEEGADAGPFVIKRASPTGDVRFWNQLQGNPAPFFALDWSKVGAMLLARLVLYCDAMFALRRCMTCTVRGINLVLVYVCHVSTHNDTVFGINHARVLQAGDLEYDLAAMAEPDKHPSVAAAEAESSGPRDVTLDQCLDAFTTAEQLDAADSWYCSKCKDHVRANKKLDLWTLPEVLVVHLKRFSCSRLWRDKLDCGVDFPLEGLDLSQYLLQQQVRDGCHVNGLPDASTS